MKHVFSLIATMTVGAVFLLPQTGCTGVYAVGPAYGPMVELTMAERASIMAPTMVVRPTGTMVPGAPTVRGVATLLGTMAREAPEDGAEALPHGITDRRVSAVTAADQLRGAVALAAQRVAGHGLLGRRLGLIPWGFRSLGLMETVMM